MPRLNEADTRGICIDRAAAALAEAGAIAAVRGEGRRGLRGVRAHRTKAPSDPHVPGQLPADGGDAWEQAYLRFQSPEQEVRKFVRRLRKLGATDWPRDAAVVELFCGRGNGLRALERLGFSNLTGVDLSPSLANRYEGPARWSSTTAGSSRSRMRHTTWR